MRIRNFILVMVLLSIGNTLYAANGDLIVNGNLGVGTNTPNTKLHVNGDIKSEGSIYSIANQSNPSIPTYTYLLSWGLLGTGSVAIESAKGTDLTLTDNWNATGTLHIRYGKAYFDTGNVGIGSDPGTYKLYVNGPFFATSGPWNTSDIKYKEDITPIADSLDNVLRINGVSFKWKTNEYKDKGFPDGRHFGVIAQEIEKVLPYVVKSNSDGTKSVAYTEIIPLLIEAIKEQQKQIDRLRNEVQVLRNTVR